MLDFELSVDQLVEIAEAFVREVEEGLEEDGRELKCLLTYCPVVDPLPQGTAVVLDLGGTRVRAALVEFVGGRAQVLRGPAEDYLPVERGVPLERERFLEVQTRLVASLDPPPGLPLGYCFSYPAASGPDGDARLITWTKEVFVPDTEGYLVGKLLMEALWSGGIECSSVSVVNDTVASLLAGLCGEEAGGHVGLIVGTGTNMATFVNAASTRKFPEDVAWSGRIPVNLESGNFTQPYLTRWDDMVDHRSENPGQQRFEKSVSGAYLGRLLKAVLPAADFDADSGSKVVVELACDSSCSDGRRIAAAILERSARLAASASAGLVRFLGPPKGRIRIVAEGGLFWGAPGYVRRFEQTLVLLLGRLGCVDTVPEIVQLDNANLTGTAIAALGRERATRLR